jgi:mono/diheme cytochrome c family protein
LSNSSRRNRAHGLSALCLLLLTSSLGCWEQWSVEWFPQMKWQNAVQPFERVAFEGSDAAFLPPEGSVPVHGYEPLVGRLDIAATDALQNPRDPADFRTVANGERLYRVYCLPCHGPTGMGDGPVSMTGAIMGPFAGVFPLVGTTTMRSDGYLYNVMRIGNGGAPGFRMPSYHRAPPMDRWDLVNYVRHLDRKGGQP